MTRERFNAQMYVDYYVAQRGISVEEIGVAPVVVISWVQKVIQSIANIAGAQICPNWFYDEDHVIYQLYTGEVHGHRVSFVLAPEGAPATIQMMEEMIACGAQTFLGLGWAGSLRPSVPIGTMIIPTSCICEEGTSSHYQSDESMFAPDDILANLLQSAAVTVGAKVISGTQWTTDAPYRELISKIESYQRKGVIGVDMETSAMYALGKFRGVKVCNLLVVSDEIWGKWRPEFRAPELREATMLAQRVILKCLEFAFDGDDHSSNVVQRKKE
ncbi:MAG: nucleoside phosphorylase [Ignavibacteriae bacterium]|nr:nucleoside phosphorylase [Ignavibacteria bacterium]MBI3365265.1 nucleoside phosphorylase [Ignavibacteriota bacterium]